MNEYHEYLYHEYREYHHCLKIHCVVLIAIAWQNLKQSVPDAHGYEMIVVVCCCDVVVIGKNSQNFNAL